MVSYRYLAVWERAPAKVKWSVLMKLSMRWLALGLLLAGAVQAQTSEEEELEALLALLDEETEIATQTRLNADYVPGVVTVLRGEDVAALGARHVLDALALVPGIEALRDDIGNATLRVRGIDYFENSGQVKVLVNGLSYARETAGQNGSVMLMPIELVDRIEVIRGPGSEVYGDFAFAGLVNILTKEDRSLAFAQGGGGGLRSAGVNLSHESGEDFRINLGLARFAADDLEAATTTSIADEERYFGHFNLYYNDFSFKVSAVDRSAIQSGRGNVLRPREDEGLAAELRYRWTLGADVQMQSWLNYADNDMQNNNTLFFAGSRRELGSSATWRRGKHRFLAQASYGRRDYESRILPPPPPPPGGPPPPPGPPAVARELTDRDRTVASASLQDEIELGSVTLTLGARYDWLEGIDQRITPRLAAVWRINDQHALKTQYTEGFRSGTAGAENFRNQINDQLDYEVMRTAELQYIYRRPETSFKATLYAAEVDDRHQVDPSLGAPPISVNFGTVDSHGIELEWWRQFGTRWRALANVSFQDTDAQGNLTTIDGPSFAQAEWLANLGLIATPTEQWTFGAHLNRVGERTILDGEKLGGYTELNLNASYRPSWAEGLEFRGTARNALDSDVTYVFFLPPGNVRQLAYDERRLSLEVIWGW